MLRKIKKYGLLGPLKAVKAKYLKRMQQCNNSKYDPTSVSYSDAIKWFKRRQQSYGYDKLISAAAPYVDKKGTILDMGANIGFFTKLLAEKAQFTGTVYLFEPVPNLAGLCRNNFKNVPYEVKIFECGLGDQDGRFDIYIAADGNIGWNTFVREKASADMRKVSVQMRRYDSIGLDVTPNFIKIDVEGSEWRVLRGMTGSLRSWKALPVILCEVSWGKSHPAWNEEMATFRKLQEIGYAMFDIEGKPIKVDELDHAICESGHAIDVLFLPRERKS